MLRIYKHYNFNLTELRPAADRMSFSSYPGELFSDDDFYLLSSGLVMLQVGRWDFLGSGVAWRGSGKVRFAWHSVLAGFSVSHGEE